MKSSLSQGYEVKPADPPDYTPLVTPPHLLEIIKRAPDLGRISVELGDLLEPPPLLMRCRGLPLPRPCLRLHPIELRLELAHRDITRMVGAV